jgi:hypothetical protein
MNFFFCIFNFKKYKMYRTTIEEAVEAVKTATKEASKTKESMIKFLFDAGIIKEKEYKQKLKIFAKEKLN